MEVAFFEHMYFLSQLSQPTEGHRSPVNGDATGWQLSGFEFSEDIHRYGTNLAGRVEWG